MLLLPYVGLGDVQDPDDDQADDDERGKDEATQQPVAVWPPASVACRASYAGVQLSSRSRPLWGTMRADSLGRALDADRLGVVIVGAVEQRLSLSVHVVVDDGGLARRHPQRT